jgi:hypothetical protein
MALIFIVALYITLFFLVPAIFQWLWNITMPEVFGLNELTYWQAFRLLLIATMLVGGAGFIKIKLGN